MELDNPHSAKHHCHNSGKKHQWTIKPEGKRGMRRGGLHGLRASPWKNHVHQVTEVHMLGIRTNKYRGPPDRRTEKILASFL